jgi:uncharacterized protein (DUF1778 family)
MMTKAADKDDRITARVSSHTKRTIEEAADILGATMNQFIVQAAFEKAEKIVEKARTLSFSKNEVSKLLDIISNPPKPNAALRKAAKRHAEILD